MISLTRPPGSPKKWQIAEVIEHLVDGELPISFTAYDGSTAGPQDSEFGLALHNERGLRYLVTAPGDLGLARAHVSGDLDLVGVSPGDPYPAMVAMRHHLEFKFPNPVASLRILRSLGIANLQPPPPPPQEHLPRWRRAMEGIRHSLTRDSIVIRHHYDVSNRFYEMVLGPSMTYTCAVFPSLDATLEEAQFAKYDLVARKLNLSKGQRLLDVGCGWGGMVRHAAKEYGVKALGVTLSAAQAEWAQAAIREEGLEGLAEVRHLDYRQVAETGFDAISSIGLTEHIGVSNYPAYFTFLRQAIKPGGRLLNHCITRPHNQPESTGPFIDRYVFPDGELTGSGRIIAEAQNVGWEVRHEENLREHYTMTLAGWNRNLAANWDACVEEVGEATARVWGLYIAGSRLSFETNEIQLHQVLAVRPEEGGDAHWPLRPDWLS